jgi:hypothetical protein
MHKTNASVRLSTNQPQDMTHTTQRPTYAPGILTKYCTKKQCFSALRLSMCLCRCGYLKINDFLLSSHWLHVYAKWASANWRRHAAGTGVRRLQGTGTGVFVGKTLNLWVIKRHVEERNRHFQHFTFLFIWQKKPRVCMRSSDSVPSLRKCVCLPPYQTASTKDTNQTQSHMCIRLGSLP